MKMKKKLLLTMLIGVLCFTSLFAGGQQECESFLPTDPGNVSDSITITDSKGREVTVNLPVERIAFSHFATGEALKIVDAWDMVVGRDSFTSDRTIFPNLDEIPLISGMSVYELNYEKIFEMDVDLFIAVDIPMPGFNEMVSKLEPDIPVVTLNFHEPSTMKENIEKLGLLLGREKEAEEYSRWYEKLIGEMIRKTEVLDESDKPSLFYKTGWGGIDDIQTFTDDFTAIPERNMLTGCINTAANLLSAGGWVQAVDPEWLAAQNVDILVVCEPSQKGYGTGVDDETVIRQNREQIIKHSVFNGFDAVKNNRVYMIAGEFFGTPRFIIGFSYMAKWFHPELFSDFDPKAIHQDYLTRFMRIDYDLNEHGVFVYPEE
ncbi:MAG: ABC transporter substrate-binding protein [Spirochaetales bacterium]|nr:ABC transporter substrate-binding protein [Spirochaetales bacterium]